MRLPELSGVLTASDLAATGASIAEVQQPNGAIPWFPGGHVDTWDHVECAMALDVVGLHDEALRAYEWLRRTQRPDGSWPARFDDGRPTELHTDANFCAYVAVGVWHHHLVTGDHLALRRLWPTVRRALDRVVSMQRAGGQIGWAAHGDDVCADALLTGSSSIYQSLRCGLAIARAVGEERPDWELATGRLGHAIADHPERFLDRSRYSMDWYYPVLGGALRGVAAERRIERAWSRFVVGGLGIRCVDDRPWVTGAETCELALALDALGERGCAAEIVASMQHLRDPDGSYWTGYVFEDRVRWPVERSSWTGAACILAVDAIADGTPAAGIFRGTGLPLGVSPTDVWCVDEVGAVPVERSAVVCYAP